MNKRRYFTPRKELFFRHNGISFIREEFGGFSRQDARYLLPRIIRSCRDSYVEGRNIETTVGCNSYATSVRIRGMEVVRVKQNQPYDEHQLLLL